WRRQRISWRLEGGPAGCRSPFRRACRACRLRPCVDVISRAGRASARAHGGLRAREVDRRESGELHGRLSPRRLPDRHDRDPRHRGQRRDRDLGFPEPGVEGVRPLRRVEDGPGDADGGGEGRRMACRQLGLQHAVDRYRARGLRLHPVHVHDCRVQGERAAHRLDLLAVGRADGPPACDWPLSGAGPESSGPVRRREPSHRSRAVLELAVVHEHGAQLRAEPAEPAAHDVRRARDASQPAAHPEPAPRSRPPHMMFDATATPGNQTVTLRWAAARTCRTPVASYHVTGEPGDIALDVPGTTLTAKITGLQNGVRYRFTVTAINGDGQSSASSNAVVPFTTPSAPSNVVALAASGSATVSWTVPGDGGLPITGYVVTPYAGGVTALPAVTFRLTNSMEVVSGLTNGTAYTFVVAAINGGGTGAPSTPSNSVTPSVALRPA